MARLMRRVRPHVLALGALLAAMPAALPAAAQDASEFVVRLGRLENQSRMMAGQIETLQYENRQLREQLRKFQEDVEFRLQEGKGGSRPAAAPVNGGNPGAGAPTATKPQRRGDAFDPAQDPGRPGAPLQLGTASPLPPLAEDRTPPAPQVATDDVARAAPRTLPRGAIEEDDEDGPERLVDLTPPARVGATASVAPLVRPNVAATGDGDAGTDYAAAYAHIQAREYERAEMSLRQFIQSHPRDGQVPAATYWLGESYLQRSRNREAAEQFLKVSTDYARSPLAPEAMLKLGTSLNALGAKEQACATLAELERKFPAAGPGVRQGVVREQKRARCAA